MLVGIVLLNFNNFEDTLDCIHSLATMKSVKYRIIVVDNSSTDLPPAELLDNSHVTFIKNDFNYGFAKGCNIGIKYAIENLGCEYIWLLNNDCKVYSKTLVNMLNLIVSEKNVGAVGSKILYPDGRVQCLGGGQVNFNTLRPKNIVLERELDKIDYICGASILFSSDIFDKTGGLDEWFFLYWEDVDFCLRLKNLGFKLVVALDSIVEHKESGTMSKFSGVKDFFGQQSRVYISYKYSTTKVLFVSAAATLIKMLLTFKFKRMYYAFSGIVSGVLKINFNINRLPGRIVKKIYKAV